MSFWMIFDLCMFLLMVAILFGTRTDA